MKKWILLTFMFIAANLLVACNQTSVSFTINFDSNGGMLVEPIKVGEELTITLPTDPEKEGFIFDGWFWDNGTFEVPFTANSLLDTPIEDDLTVYAKWVQQDDELTAQLKSIYLLAVQVNAFQGTYEEWLETVRGPQGVPGEDGKSSLLRINGGVLEWQLEGDSSWTALYDLNNLAGSDGIDGKNIFLQVAEGYIQWQYQGDTSWNNLVELTTLVGPSGADGVDGIDGKQVTFQVSEGFIQWQYVGDTTWTNLVSLSTLTGSDGDDGREVEFFVNETHIQWRYIGDTDYHNIVDLTSLKGDTGNGISSIKLTGTEGLIDTYTITYTNGTTSTFTVTNGSDGKSAYEIYIENYPDYSGDEQQWLNDLINGNLGIVVTFTVSFDSNGGTAVASQEVEDNDKALKPVEPSREGYTFLGWFINGDEKWVFGGYNVTQNITLTAHWSINSYTVTYVQNNDQEDISLTVHPFTELIQPTKAGYMFVGWFSTIDFEENTSVDIIPADNITLYAKWEIVSYQINYVLDGGVNNVLNPNTYTIVTNTIALNDLFKEGYTFLGWYTEDTFINEVTEITIGSIGDITLYAQFIPYQFIEYDTYIAIIGGKTDLMPIPTMILGKPVTELYSGMYNTFGGYNPVYIPDTISYIDDTFGQYAYSSEWLVDDSNQYYTSIDGVLYTKDLSILISYPNHKIDTTFVLKPEVREIAWGAFYWNDHLLSIELNEGLEIIGAFAFMWSNLTSIHIPSTVQEIHTQAFYGKLNSWYGYEDLNYLTSVSFAENSQLTLIHTQAFLGNRIQNLVLPDSVEYIGDQAFGYYEGEITLPSSLKELYLSAFFSVSNSTLIIPASVTDLIRPGNPYHYSPYTVNFDFDINNANYTSVDGVIYNKESTEIIAIPRGKIDIVLPSTVTHQNEYYVHFWSYMSIYLEMAEKPSSFSDTWFDQAVIYYVDEWSYVEGVPIPN